MVLVMMATEVEEVGKGEEELMMRWFSREFISDTDQLESVRNIFHSGKSLIFNFSSGHA